MLTLFCFALIVGSARAQVSTFTSNVATGNWDAPGSWSESGSDVDHIPDADDNVIILSGHNISLNGAQAANAVTVNSGGTLTATLGSLTAGSMAVNGTGTYIHAIDGGVVPTATWASTSTCSITGVVATAPTGFAQTFGNLLWNSSGQNTNIYLQSDITIQGDFTVQATGGSLDPTNLALRMSNTATGYTIDVTGNVAINGNSTFKMNNSTGSCTMTVGGDFTLNNGNFTIVTGNANSTLSVAGDVNILGGQLLMHEDPSATTATLNVTGNFTHAGGTITETGGGAGSIVFNKAGTQTYTSGGTVSNNINYTVNSGSILQMANVGTVIGGGGNFTLASGATLGVTSSAGITTGGASGNIQVTGTRTYAAGANYIYNGTANQAVGNGLTQNTPNNLEINNPGNAVVLGAATSLTGNLAITGGTLNTNGQTVTFNGTGPQLITGSGASQTFNDLVVNKAGGTLSVGGSIGIINAANYTQTLGNFAAPATVSATGNIVLTTGTYTAGANTNVAGNFTNNASFTAGAGTVTFNGSGLQLIGGGVSTTFNNVITSNTSNTTATVATVIGSDLTIQNGTTFTVSTGNFSVDGTTVIGTGTSGNLVISSGAGTKTFEGLVLINSGGSWINSSNAPVIFQGGITNSGTFTAGTGLHTFNTNPQGLSGAFSIPNVTSDIALTNNNSLTVGTALGGSGNLIQGGAATLNLGGSFGIATITASNIGNTVVYSGSSQTVKAIPYENLTINQLSGEASLPADITVNEVLTLSSGRFNLGGFKLSLGSGATIAGIPSVSNMIIATGGGEIIKNNLNGSFVFPVGENAGMYEYSPITVNVTGGGPSDIGVSVQDAKHPNNASGTNFISRYWDVSSSANVTATVTGNYSAIDINGTEGSIGAATLTNPFNQISNPWVKSGETFAGNTLTYTGASLIAGKVSAFTGITGANPTIAIDNGATVALCKDATVSLTTTAGGDPILVYSWNPVTNLSASSVPNPVFTGTTAGGPTNYTVTVRDGNGIVATDDID
ncbi:MAG: hypothetical protein KF860_17185, partial [Cyclobacteriaceae bacterium]|nr:hypothetical protein [Cyclobacteriaceae bacterium]